MFSYLKLCVFARVCVYVCASDFFSSFKSLFLYLYSNSLGIRTLMKEYAVNQNERGRSVFTDDWHFQSARTSINFRSFFRRFMLRMYESMHFSACITLLPILLSFKLLQWLLTNYCLLIIVIMFQSIFNSVWM